MNKIKAVLLDFDGTVVDSETSRYKSSKYVLSEYGFDLKKELWEEVYKSLSSKELFDDVISKLNLDVTSDFLYQKAHSIRIDIEKNEGVEMIEGFLDFYDECRRLHLKCIICSGGTTEHVQRILNQINLDIEGFGRDKYCTRKPAPDAWIHGMKKLGVKPDEVIVFDDASTGVVAALKAGIKKACAINYDESDFKNIKGFELKTKSHVYEYFKKWNEVNLEKLISE